MDDRVTRTTIRPVFDYVAGGLLWSVVGSVALLVFSAIIYFILNIWVNIWEMFV